MGIVIRQSLKGSIVTYLGTAIGTFNVIFLYNNFLSREEIGLIAGSLVSIPLFFSSFTQLGIAPIATRFFPYFEDQENQHNGFFTFLLMTPLLGLLLFISGYLLFKPVFFEFYEQNSPLLPKYFYYIIPLTACYLYMSILEAYARVHLRIVVPAIIRELYLRISNALLIVGYAIHLLNFEELILAITLSYFIAVAGLLWYIKILKRFYLKIDLSIFKKPIFKEMYQYGFWVILAGSSFTLIQHIEKIMLPAYSGGLGNTAIFDINSRIALIIAIPRNVIASISSPLIAQAWKANDLENIENIYKKSALNLFFIGSILFLFIWVNLDFIYQIIPHQEEYRVGRYVVLMVGISKLIDMGTGLNSEILLNSKFYRYDLIFYIFLALILVIGNMVLIPIYSFNGAAMASLIALFIYNIIKYFFIWKKLKLQPFDHRIFLLIFVTLTIGFATQWIPVLGNGNQFFWFINTGIRCLIIGMSYLFIVYRFNLLPDAKVLVHETLDRFFKKKNSNP